MPIDYLSSHGDVIQALLENGLNLELISPGKRDDLSFVRIALKQNLEASKFLSESFLNNIDNIKALIEEGIWNKLAHLPDKCWSTPSIIEDLLEKNPTQVKFLPPKWANDEKFLFKLMRLNPKIFAHLPSNLTLSKKFVLEAIKNSCIIYLNDLPEILKGDEEIVLAVFLDPHIDIQKQLVQVSLPLLKNVDFAFKMIRRYPGLGLDVFFGDFWEKHNINDDTIPFLNALDQIADDGVMFTLGEHGHNQKDINFVKMALQVNPWVFNSLSEELQLNPELKALAAIKDSEEPAVKENLALCNIQKNALRFQFLDAVLKEDPRFVLKAVKINPPIFDKLSNSLLADQKFLLGAIKDKHLLFEKCPAAIVADPLFIKEAILANPEVYTLLPAAQKKLKKFAFAYLQHEPQKFYGLDQSLQKNKAFAKKTKEIFPEVNIAEDNDLIEDPDTDESWYQESPKLKNEYLKPKSTVEEPSKPLENKGQDIKKALELAQKKYAAWYDLTKLSSSELAAMKKDGYNRIGAGRSFSFFKDLKLTWFRHRKHGQLQASKLLKELATIKDDSTLEIWHEIDKHLLKSNTRFHEHSFSSFLIDELKKIKDSPLKSIEIKGKHHRYEKKEVVSKLSDYIILQYGMESVPTFGLEIPTAKMK